MDRLTDGDFELLPHILAAAELGSRDGGEDPRPLVTAELHARAAVFYRRKGWSYGVISLDVVAMSYLLEGVGPVQVGDVTLTSDNAVEMLLNRPYLELDPARQDAFFALAAKTVFESLTGDVAAPRDFFAGLSRAAGAHLRWGAWSQPGFWSSWRRRPL